MALQPRAVAESILDRIQSQLYEAGLTQGTRRATDWMIRHLKTLSVKRHQLMRDNERLTPQTFLGGMFFYFYDPKHKATLPYYDTFPLVVPIKFYDDGFLGINIHYLSPRDRVGFLNQLSGFTNNMRYDETTRFRLTYQLLSTSAQLASFQPCLKRYLAGHVRSQFLRIDGHEWHIAALLPVAGFVKATERQVWRESRSSI